MAKGRDRPRKEPKRKAKEKAPKHPGGATGSVAPSYQPPTRQVEVGMHGFTSVCFCSS